MQPARMGVTHMSKQQPDTGQPAHMYPGMSAPARASISALQRALSSNPDTIQAYVTGSQADGTATETSDLDIYHVVRGNKWLQRHYDIIRHAVADRMKVDVVVDSLETVGRHASLYGSYEYWAAHNGILVYEDRSNNDDWLKVRDAITDDVHLPDCAGRWLEFAKRHMDASESYVRDGGRGNSLPCVIYAKSISASLMAALTHDNIPFRFTRRLADLAGMLRDRSITRGHRIDMADWWRKHAWEAGADRFTTKDRQDAARMADSIYYAANKYVKHGRRNTER